MAPCSGAKWPPAPGRNFNVAKAPDVYRLGIHQELLTLDNRHQYSFLVIATRKRESDGKSEVVHENDNGSPETTLLLWS